MNHNSSSNVSADPVWRVSSPILKMLKHSRRDCSTQKTLEKSKFTAPRGNLKLHAKDRALLSLGLTPAGVLSLRRSAGSVSTMRALAAVLTGIAPLHVFFALALSGTSTATTIDVTAVDEPDHEVCMASALSSEVPFKGQTCLRLAAKSFACEAFLKNSALLPRSIRVKSRVRERERER